MNLYLPSSDMKRLIRDLKDKKLHCGEVSEYYPREKTPRCSEDGTVHGWKIVYSKKGNTLYEYKGTKTRKQTSCCCLGTVVFADLGVFEDQPIMITYSGFDIKMLKPMTLTISPISCNTCDHLECTTNKVDFEGCRESCVECADPDPVDHDVDEDGCEHWTPIVMEGCE